ncbi:MAG TPA: FAD-binding oxidoreductase, partial [Methanomassiliicoccales archaeon]|nr:FAD-binding oxidoreductase [Methanomassiliicoccales archaeon]
MNEAGMRRSPSASIKAYEGLRDRIEGTLLRPRDPGYEESRSLYNGMIRKRPALIARCETKDDICACVEFAGANDMPLSVRGGGHGVAGDALCDDGIVVDLTGMRAIRVDKEHRRAVVGPGARWRELDAATQRFGLAVTGGRISTTGVGGFTLGGGAGWLMGTCGLACDNLLSAEVVTSYGESVQASESRKADLLWALRGGGGNFGVVSSFEFDLHPIKPVLSGTLTWPRSRALEVLER